LKKGKLYLIPTPLGENAVHTIPPYVIDILHSLDLFIAEKAKTARHFIKSTHPRKAFDQLTFYELNKRTEDREWQNFLNDAEKGNDIGLLSEAGCPGVADPGAQIVELAHNKGIEVIPLVGPSSILLALMASGMNGQSFSFHGYLSPKKPELAKDLKRLENLSSRNHQAQIFIETPYRNNSLIEEALKVLNPNTNFCIAVDLTLDNQFIKNLKIKDWQKTKIPDFHKKPAIFLLQS
jgi:16S rRNA (cytidine1402-2'-O)-methyltransferase